MPLICTMHTLWRLWFTVNIPRVTFHAIAECVELFFRSSMVRTSGVTWRIYLLKWIRADKKRKTLVHWCVLIVLWVVISVVFLLLKLLFRKKTKLLLNCWNLKNWALIQVLISLGYIFFFFLHCMLMFDVISCIPDYCLAIFSFLFFFFFSYCELNVFHVQKCIVEFVWKAWKGKLKKNKPK